MKKNIILLLLACTFFNSFSQEENITKSIENEVAVIKDTIIKKVTNKVIDLKEDIPVVASVENTTTTYYIINSAEKKAVTTKQQDPYLTKQGVKRSENWTKVLASVKLDAVYTINTTSAKQTAQAISQSQKTPTYGLDEANLYDVSFKYNTKAQNVLIVGDNATSIKFANLVLNKEQFSSVEDNFGRLYILTTNENNNSSIVLTID